MEKLFFFLSALFIYISVEPEQDKSSEESAEEGAKYDRKPLKKFC